MPILKGKRLQSPIGDYHNATVIESFIEGLPPQQALQRYYDCDHNRQRYADVAQRSLTELQQRERQVDIVMSDLIANYYAQGELVFHTFNHPTKALLNQQVNRLLQHLQLTPLNLSYQGECLDRVQLRVNPMVSGAADTASETRKLGKAVNMLEFVQQSYQIYRKNPDYIAAYQLSLIHI